MPETAGIGESRVGSAVILAHPWLGVAFLHEKAVDTMRVAKELLKKSRSLLLENSAARRIVAKLFFEHLVKHTDNFSSIQWLGQPVWQNVLDLWNTQEVICEIKPHLLIECGTNRAGSAFFYAKLFDLLGHGQVITIDITKLHELTHPRIRFLLGSSVSEEVVKQVREAVSRVSGPVMVVLDSDHSAGHVRKELEAYAPFVTAGSYMLTQDGAIDEAFCFRSGRPGPAPAIREFLRDHPEFEVDHVRCDRFLITHHPLGWLRRRK